KELIMSDGKKKLSFLTVISTIICVVFVCEAAAPAAAIGNQQRLLPLQQRRPIRGSISAIFWTAVTVEEAARTSTGPSWPKRDAGGASAALF
ncbi:MAG TPA: hypothetical protein PLE35_08450, partial [Lentisphaeria bacterium]|nr:hypothetical protein [Lentisphaeria bacterium]